MKKEKLTILKIGGAVCEIENKLHKTLEIFSKIKGKKILIHGGGKLASQISEKMGIEVRMVEGRRITDNDSLKVAVMVYAGWMNKVLVGKLNTLGCNSLGLSGADLGIIKAEKRQVNTINFGFVGDLKSIDTERISSFLENGITPIFSSITIDQSGQLLNTNADTIASFMSTEMLKKFNVSLLYCFDRNGVFGSEGANVLEELNELKFLEGVKAGFINEGMIPKLKNGFDAIAKGVTEVFLGGIDSLETIVNFKKGGTRLCKS